jgi:hypothetical protein
MGFLNRLERLIYQAQNLIERFIYLKTQELSVIKGIEKFIATLIHVL